jgi:hypothetical protein
MLERHRNRRLISRSCLELFEITETSELTEALILL